MRVKAEIPEKLAFLFKPSRYKVVHGGRGGAKSWNMARALIIESVQKPVRVLCAREIQNSIKDSVHRLLRDQIDLLGLAQFFIITDRAITGANGSEFIFEGLFRNVNRIKSLEGIDRCWVEEAEKVSEESWDILTPTIRKPGSEIWISFNPQYEDDATYQRFVANPPDNAVVRQINYEDNPYFPEVLRLEMEQDKARDNAAYEHKWLGIPKGGGRRIWTAFDKEIHVVDIPMEEIAKRGNCYMAMDPHSHFYPFCVWIAVLPKNKRMSEPGDFYRHVYAEFPGIDDISGPYHEMRKKLFYQGSLADLSREILARDGAEYGIKVRNRYMDTRFAKGSGAWNWSTQTQGVIEQFAKRENGGILFNLPEEKRIDAQRQAIHDDMLWNTIMPKGPFNEPSFSVSPKCKNVIASLVNHRLEEDSDKEDEKYKDPSDALRICYAGMSGQQYVDPATPEPTFDLELSGSFWSA